MNRFNEYYDGVESVEIPIKSTTDTKYYFPNVPGLKGKIIKRIEVSKGLTMTPGNRTMISDANLKLAFLTIVDDKNIIVHRIPLYFLQRLLSYLPVITDIFSFTLKDTEQSYIEFAQTSGLSTSESIFLNFFYNKTLTTRRTVTTLVNRNLIDSALDKSEIDRIYPIQVEINDATKTVFPFPNDEFLMNKKVRGIKLYADVSELVAVTLHSPDDKTIIADTIYKKSFLVLQLKNGLKINNLPLNMITYDFWLDTEILFNDIEIDWPKSYIKVANNTSIVANTVFYFLINYRNAS